MMKKSHGVQIADYINFFTFLLVSACCIWLLVTYALVKEPVSFLVMLIVSLFLSGIALLSFKARLSILNFLVSAIGVVLVMCTSYSIQFFSLQPILIALISFIGALLGSIFQLVFKSSPQKKGGKLVGSLSLCLAAVLSFLCPNFYLTRTNEGNATAQVFDVPDKYEQVCVRQGSCEQFFYSTYAYATDKREVVKTAYVYLPYGYTSQKRYDVLYLLHGTNEDEGYWLVQNENNKNMLDNMIYYGDMKEVIVVTPTWYTENDCADAPDQLTYAFTEELRNQLIPFVEETYSTYAGGDVSSESLTKTRNHRAFAGLSRGAFITYRCALAKCLDYFSSFGAFSGCGTDEDYLKENLQSEKNKAYTIDYLYNTSGSFDFLLKEHKASFDALLGYEKRLTLNENCSFDVFPTRYHSMGSWHLALYNFMQKIFL